MTAIIEVKGIGKKYKISHHRGGYISLRDVLMNIFRKPSAFLKQKAQSAMGIKNKEDFWALKDINFNVNKGEVIGIIGKNGAGKSTLLKILSQITEPTEGEIIMRGSVGSLLEVGTGFHPELTGRENIFLNGAILGMTRKEMASKFDKIVEFAGIEKFLDTPVKHYSSGMYVRLAFSVAAHIEPDILIIDEVLAVGDVEFQKKCLGKMEEVTHKDGRTILFVSHNLSAVEQLCKRSILLENGQVTMIGDTTDVISHYLTSAKSLSRIDLDTTRQHNPDYEVLSFRLENSVDGHFTAPWDEPVHICTQLRIKRPTHSLSFAISFGTLNGTVIFWVRDSDKENKLFSFDTPGVYEVRAQINHNLRAGKYQIAFGVTTAEVTTYHNPDIAILEISKNGSGNKKYFDDNRGIVNCTSSWDNSLSI